MNPRIWLACALGLATAAIATAPLSLLVERVPLAAQGVSALEASGSVWRGVLRSAIWRKQSLGDVSIRLQPLPLLLGERRLRLDSGSWRGTLLDGRRVGLVDGIGSITLPPSHALGGATLLLSMQDAALVFEDGRCTEASGGLQATLQMADPTLPELRLAGELSCAREQGRVVLASTANAPLRLDAVLDIDANGAYTLQSTARAQDQASRLALQLAGFQETPSGLVRNDTGSLGD